MFNIELFDNEVEVFNEKMLPAKIVINDYKEDLLIPVSFWSIENYISNWKKCLLNGLDNKSNVALVTSMYDAKEVNFISAWIVYFCNQRVFLQNSIIFLDGSSEFSADEVNSFVEPREIFDEDGNKISEWEITIQDLIKFYQKL